ncbi:MAG: carboxymuconolactone decarboxylase family protein [Leptospiraceae bacterium]|nr:carboxymuconolactone decarboxylase family protein [Leptospiraceae bacterium]
MSTKDVKPTSFDLSTISPEFANLTKDLLFGDIWNREGLSQRDKSLITITSLVSQNRIEQMASLQKGITRNNKKKLK